jgi:hypothetical protein
MYKVVVKKNRYKSLPDLYKGQCKGLKIAIIELGRRLSPSILQRRR